MLDIVEEALDELTPPFPVEDGDWADVLARAAAESNGSTVATRPSRLPNARGRSARRGLRLALTVAAAAALIAATVSLWPSHGSSSVLASALAAIGRGSVTHVVLLNGGNSALVDLHTGARTPVQGRTEIWSDPQRGMVVVTSFRGRVTGRYFIPPASAQSSSSFETLLTGYRSDLRAHRYRITGSGIVAGTPVYWIESTPTWVTNLTGSAVYKVADQIAISKTTYKPILERRLSDGNTVPGSTRRILAAETTAARPSLFNRHRYTSLPEWGWGATSLSLTAAEIRARLHHAAVYPKQVGNLKLTWQGESPYTLGNGAEITGISLYYGPLNTNTGRGGTVGDPDYSGSYVSINEFATKNVITQSLGPEHFPTNGKAILDAPDLSLGNSATLRTHGLFVIIRGSSDKNVLAAARQLAKG